MNSEVGMNDPNNPVVLANLPSDAEAALLIAYLQSVGITARLSGAGGATGWPEGVRYVQVVVRQADLERAKDAMEAAKRGRGEDPNFGVE
jgi:hypothetical protein